MFFYLIKILFLTFPSIYRYICTWPKSFRFTVTDKLLYPLPSVGRWVDGRDHNWTTRCTLFWNTTQPSVRWLQLQQLSRTKQKLWVSILQPSTHRHFPLRLSPGIVVWRLSLRRSKNQEWSPETAKRKTVKIATQVLFKPVLLMRQDIF